MEPKAVTRRDELPASARYELLVKIASGGMATVYVGRSTAAIARQFAIKRAHSHLVDDPVFRRMFVAEARLASRIHHPNVVAVQDVAELEDELLLVMDYVEGLALVDLEPDDPAVAIRVVLDACAGLHAAHELRGDDGEPLGIVHRDVSPHNILVGVDGVARVTDFGIAKSELHTGAATVTGALKGKLAYMAPEYVETGKADRRADVYALGVVLWEALTGERLFRASSEVELMKLVLNAEIRPAGVNDAVDAVVAKALARSPDDRYPTADAFAAALEAAARETSLLVSHREVATVVEREAHDVLEARRAALRARTSKAASEPAEAKEEEEIAEPTRTETLNAPPTPSPVAYTDPVRPPASRSPGLAIVAAVLVIGAGVAFVTLRGGGEPTPTPAHAASSAPVATSATAPSTSSSTPAITTSEPPPAPSSSASSAPSSSPSSRPQEPRVVKPLPVVVAPQRSSSPSSSPSALAPPLASSAPPTPSIAPPNPYKRP